jgi:hypothetical protein
MAKRQNDGLSELRIVVDRCGFGTHKWRWRLINECDLVVAVATRFHGPEAAYAAAQRKLFEMQMAAEIKALNGTGKRPRHHEEISASTLRFNSSSELAQAAA